MPDSLWSTHTPRSDTLAARTAFASGKGREKLTQMHNYHSSAIGNGRERKSKEKKKSTALWVTGQKLLGVRELAPKFLVSPLKM